MGKSANRLYYDDNLDILRRHSEDELVDPISLNPAFNSNPDENRAIKDRRTITQMTI